MKTFILTFALIFYVSAQQILSGSNQVGAQVPVLGGVQNNPSPPPAQESQSGAPVAGKDGAAVGGNTGTNGKEAPVGKPGSAATTPKVAAPPNVNGAGSGVNQVNSEPVQLG